MSLPGLEIGPFEKQSNKKKHKKLDKQTNSVSTIPIMKFFCECRYFVVNKIRRFWLKFTDVFLKNGHGFADAVSNFYTCINYCRWRGILLKWGYYPRTAAKNHIQLQIKRIVAQLNSKDIINVTLWGHLVRTSAQRKGVIQQSVKRRTSGKITNILRTS